VVGAASADADGIEVLAEQVFGAGQVLGGRRAIEDLHCGVGVALFDRDDLRLREDLRQGVGKVEGGFVEFDDGLHPGVPDARVAGADLLERALHLGQGAPCAQRHGFDGGALARAGLHYDDALELACLAEVQLQGAASVAGREAGAADGLGLVNVAEGAVGDGGQCVGGAGVVVGGVDAALAVGALGAFDEHVRGEQRDVPVGAQPVD